jgi:hypothetical protein
MITIYGVLVAVTVVVTVIVTTEAAQVSAEGLRVNTLRGVVFKLEVEGTPGVIVKAPVLVNPVKVEGTPRLIVEALVLVELVELEVGGMLRLIVKAPVFVDSVELDVEAPVLADPVALEAGRLASAPVLVAPRPAASAATLLVAVTAVELDIEVAPGLDEVVTDVVFAENIVDNSVSTAVVDDLVKVESIV